MSNIQCIAEHSVDLSLIARDSKVLDCGCREFSFANAMLEHIDFIRCLDADTVFTENPNIDLRFGWAISDKDDYVPLVKFGNGTGNYVNGINGVLAPAGSVMLIIHSKTLQSINKHFGVHYWDLIKLDVEGSEIPVLLALKEPPAKQITVEFHMHTGTTKEQVEAVIKHLEQWYDVAFCDYSRKHGLVENYWDTLFILK